MQYKTLQQATLKVDRLHRYWQGLARPAATDPTQPRLPPPRHLLDPAALIDLLPYLLLAEFETTPFRIRYRLTGTRIDEASGVNLTGTYLDEIDGGASEAIFRPMIENYRHAWRSGEAVIASYRWTTQQGRVKVICYGIFPLTVAGEIRQAIAIEEYDSTADPDPLKPLYQR